MEVGMSSWRATIATTDLKELEMHLIHMRAVVVLSCEPNAGYASFEVFEGVTKGIADLLSLWNVINHEEGANFLLLKLLNSVVYCVLHLVGPCCLPIVQVGSHKVRPNDGGLAVTNARKELQASGSNG